MFDKIVYIGDRSATIKLKDSENVVINLMNLHLIFEDGDKKILGEVDDLDKDLVKARFLGEIVDGKLIGGVIRKPSLDASIRVITPDEIPMIVGEDSTGYMKFGLSPFYNDYPVYLNVNNFFSNHFAIFGNSGSGKSCGISRIFQNMFHDKRLFPYKSNIILIDSSGEYYNAFKDLNSIDRSYHYRFISTNEIDGVGENLRIPIWLLNANDLTLLLQVTNHSQIPIIERMLKLARIFSSTDIDANKYKNHLIAKAIMAILYTNETSPNKRNEIFSILESCSTDQFNLEADLQGVGYTRKFRECFLIDTKGQFTESVLLTEYVTSFINDEYDNFEPSGGEFYTLDTLEKALNFTLISEGWLRNEQTYGDAVTLKVRLHSLIVGDNAKYFDYPNYISLESYLSSLLLDSGNKYQIININLDDVDDDFAKVITKIYSRLIFEFAKGLKDRASIPFHIVVEEAHRYIQNDTDRFLIGYNIFERIAKEGRKYGVILGLISQRPVELSDTVISQCSNFLIFKMNHPVDVDYIRKMVPNISDEIIEKQKSLQSGTCLGFGSAFKIPLIVRLEMPNPAPYSGNANVVSIWNGGNVMPEKKENNDSLNQSSVQQVVTPSFKKVERPATESAQDNKNEFINSIDSKQNDNTLAKLVSITSDKDNQTINSQSQTNNQNFDVMAGLNQALKENSIMDERTSTTSQNNSVSNNSVRDKMFENKTTSQSNSQTDKQLLDKLLGNGGNFDSGSISNDQNSGLLNKLMSNDLNDSSNSHVIENKQITNDVINNSNNSVISKNSFSSNGSNGIPNSIMLNSLSKESDNGGNINGTNGIPDSSLLNSMSNSKDEISKNNFLDVKKNANGVADNLDMSDILNNRELVVPNNSVDVPSEMQLTQNRDTIAPNIVEEKKVDGTIRIVPPTQDGSAGMFMTLDDLDK